MEYKVLYRKYRPNDFENIVDQEYTVDILKNSILSNKISHAYIFSGPRGTGKTTTAKVLAKSINCENFSDNGPCNECFSCKNFSSSPDIIEIDAASNNGVDEIREIINSIKLAPTNSKYKVYIIDEVHMLSQSAFNALLLTLEEPPKHVVFIFATTNIESVPVTILSRCQRFDFKKISEEAIINRLNYVCENEKIVIDEDALKEIAYLADGGMRDALSILDQLSGKNEKITLEVVVNHFGSISIKKIDEIIYALERSDNNTIIKLIDEFRKSSVEYKNLIKKLLDVLHKKAIEAKENIDYCGLDYSTIKNLSFDLVDCLNKINVAIDPFMLIELTILNYTKTVNSNNLIAEHKKIEEKEEVNLPKNTNMKESKEAFVDNNNSDLKKIRINNCFFNAKKEYLETIKKYWNNFINSNKLEKSVFSLLIDVIPVAASNEYIILSSTLSDTANLVNSRLKDIEINYNNIFETNYKFIALSELEWDDEKKIYINNIKNHVAYEFIEEPSEETKKNSELEKIANDIFSEDKIEIN